MDEAEQSSQILELVRELLTLSYGEESLCYLVIFAIFWPHKQVYGYL